MMKYFAVLLACCLFTVACSSPQNKTTPTTSGGSSPTELSDQERELLRMLPSDQQNCTADRSGDTHRRWVAASAILICESPDLSSLLYGLFSNASDMDATYVQQATYLKEEVESKGGVVMETAPGEPPCSKNPNESGQWGSQEGDTFGGRFTCISTPHPRIVWTERTSSFIGDAEKHEGTMNDLIVWWRDKAGPQ